MNEATRHSPNRDSIREASIIVPPKSLVQVITTILGACLHAPQRKRNKQHYVNLRSKVYPPMAPRARQYYRRGTLRGTHQVFLVLAVLMAPYETGAMILLTKGATTL